MPLALVALASDIPECRLAEPSRAEVLLLPLAEVTAILKRKAEATVATKGTTSGVSTVKASHRVAGEETLTTERDEGDEEVVGQEEERFLHKTGGRRVDSRGQLLAMAIHSKAAMSTVAAEVGLVFKAVKRGAAMVAMVVGEVTLEGEGEERTKAGAVAAIGAEDQP